MSKNNASEQVVQVAPVETVSTEVPEVTVKSVLSALYGDARLSDDKREMSGSFGTRQESGFDRLAAKDRNAVKKAVQARFDHFMRDGQFVLSQPLWTVLTSLDGSVQTAKVVTEETVRALVAEKVAMLRYAADVLFAGSVEIVGYDGISPILEESDIPELSDEMVEKAMKFASVTTGAKTKEHDIPELIRSTFADWPSGTFRTIAQIRGAIAQNNPNLTIGAEWDGRLNASLFGTTSGKQYEADIQPVSAKSPEALAVDEKGRAGAIRL
jgi:hypothetical protein